MFRKLYLYLQTEFRSIAIGNHYLWCKAYAEWTNAFKIQSLYHVEPAKELEIFRKHKKLFDTVLKVIPNTS
ncbi:hypothetical protein AAMO2058_000743500 [Amorphochlora amoebiformis]